MQRIYEIDLDHGFSFIKYGDNKGAYNGRFKHTYCLDAWGPLDGLMEVLKGLLRPNDSLLKKSLLLKKPMGGSLAPGVKFEAWDKLRIEKVPENEVIGLFPYENNNGLSLNLHDENISDFLECLVDVKRSNQEQCFVLGDDTIFVAP